MRVIQILLILLGRIFLSSIFILSAIHKIFDWQGTEKGLSNALCEWQSFVGPAEGLQNFFAGLLPWVPFLMVLAIALELVGGIMLLFGLKGRLGAFFLILFLIPTTLFFHQFWYLEGFRRELEMVMFLKNIAILGGLLFVIVYGTGIREKGHGSVDNPDLRDEE